MIGWFYRERISSFIVFKYLSGCDNIGMLRRLSHLRFRQSIFHTLQTRGHIIFVTDRILINVDQNAGRERGLSIWTFYTG